MKYASIFLLSTSLLSAAAFAGSNTEAAVGGALGGALGSVVGEHLGGSTGATIGAGVGGAAGGMVGADKRSRTEAAIGGGLGAAGGNVIGQQVGGSTGGLIGAAVGDRVSATPPAQLGSTAADTGRLSYHAWVSASNTVTVMLTNASAAAATTNAAIQTEWLITIFKV